VRRGSGGPGRMHGRRLLGRARPVEATCGSAYGATTWAAERAGELRGA